MNCGRQALSFCLDAAVVVVIQIFNKFLLELIPPMLVLPALVRMKDQPGSIRYLLIFSMEIPI